MTAKDFIFYVGCDCLIFDNFENPKLGSPSYIEGVDIIANKVICERANFDPSLIKPILRPISDMKIEEAIKIMEIVILNNVEYPNWNYKFWLNDYQNPTIQISNDWYFETLVIGKRGSVWSPDKVSQNIKVPAIVSLFLIQQRFDLFGLIENGKAISVC